MKHNHHILHYLSFVQISFDNEYVIVVNSYCVLKLTSMNENIDSVNIENSVSPNRETPTSKKGGFWEFARFISIVVIIVVVVRGFIAQPFIVSGASMVPTFHDADYLIVDEISYRFSEPSRGDVLIFHPPINNATYFIKRIIGVPGDTVTINNGKVTITNTEHPEGMQLTEPYISNDTTTAHYSVKVTEGNYFVMGDNRPASYDSRGWGLLPKKNITGRAFLRLFPLSRIGIFPGEHTNY